MLSSGPGRPRLTQSLRPGASPRDEILDAAAELFTAGGFATTSTRAIADAVGIRQSSLYHHFATKNDLLEALLAGTVTDSLEFAQALFGTGPADPEEAAVQLHALALFDGGQLCRTRWNLGVLYHLPEVQDERFLPFRRKRHELRQWYRLAGSQLEEFTGGPGGTGELAFRLVESLVNLRADGMVAPSSAVEVADACLRLAGYRADIGPVRLQSIRLGNSSGKNGAQE